MGLQRFAGSDRTIPLDEHGTRYPGWVRAHDVEVVAAGEPRSVLRHFVEAVEQAKARLDAQAAEDEARLERARLKVEEARQQYEALTNNAPALAPEQTKSIRSCPRPVSSASSADRIADSIIASIITSRASRGSAATALAFISSVSSC